MREVLLAQAGNVRLAYREYGPPSAAIEFLSARPS
jgi:hypothetical protein